jgi:hypothetical protein
LTAVTATFKACQKIFRPSSLACRAFVFTWRSMLSNSGAAASMDSWLSIGFLSRPCQRQLANHRVKLQPGQDVISGRHLLLLLLGVAGVGV